MTSHKAMLHTISKKGANSIRNPLLNSVMLCIEGTAAVVRGDIENEGKKPKNINSFRKIFSLV